MAYEDSVFVNCPFDGEYEPLFRALVFGVYACGFTTRCALELDDASQGRIERIRRMIAESRFGIHDLSRTEPDADTGLPRINMPLELGIFLGAKLFGGTKHRQKACIIFDREKYRYQRFCSDIAGQDVRAHEGEEREVIRGVRDALQTWRRDRQLPGGAAVFDHYQHFVNELPELASDFRLDPQDLTFNDLTTLVYLWLRTNGSGTAAEASGAG